MQKTRTLEKGQRCYSSENHFVREFCDALQSADSPWGKVHHIKEFDYLRGRTDVVAVDLNNELISFELKLANWPKALEQAYRNTCFTHRSYVVLPERILNRAHRQRSDFERRKVGMCYVDDGKILITVPSKRQEPIQPWLSNRATVKAAEGHVRVRR